MGYQESLIYIQPQSMFKAMMKTYEQAERSGYYHLAGAEPLSVITLKQPVGQLPAGTKLLWVCGDRGFHTEGGIFGQRISNNPFKHYQLTFIPAERPVRPIG